MGLLSKIWNWVWGNPQEPQNSQGLGIQQNVPDTNSPEIQSGSGTNEEEEHRDTTMPEILKRPSPQSTPEEKKDVPAEQAEKAPASVTAPSGQNDVPGKRVLTKRARDHMKDGRWKGTKISGCISGCHNEENFIEMAKKNNCAYYKIDTKGLLSLYKYQVWNLKTVYDSDKISDDNMLNLAEEAMNKGKVTNKMIEGKGEAKTEAGTEEITFRGYLNEQGEVDTVYPIIP